jgi:hypothetical protein
MTGVVWFKLQAKINAGKFPGIDSILKDEFSDMCDKNKLPLASIKCSFDLGHAGKGP